MKSQEFDPNKQITNLKEELPDEKKHIKERCPQVNLAIDKPNLFLSMYDGHNKACQFFTLLWDEYYDKYKPSGDQEEAP